MKIINSRIPSHLCYYLLLFFVIGLTGPVVTTVAQCNGSKINHRAFYSISPTFHDELINRLDEFLKNKCDKKFERLYMMLTPSFRQLNRRADFVRDYKAYYGGKDGLVSFRPVKVGQTTSSVTGEPDVWFIEGCLSETINGRKRSIKVILEAIRDMELGRKQIFFTDITTRPNQLGPNDKCRA